MNALRFNIRQLLKTPGFTIVALLTLAFGIGVNSTAYSVVNALLFRSPYPGEEQLVRIFRTSPQSQSWPHAVANFLDHGAQSTVFSHVAAAEWTGYNLAETGQPAEQLRGLNVTADFLPILGVQPQLGRWFTAEEDQPGHNAVIVLSYSAWQRRFGADPEIVGRQVRLNAESVTVVGIMPASFAYPVIWGAIDGWRPLAFSNEARQNRNRNYLQEIARLKPGVTLAQAQAELNTIAARLSLAYPDHNANTGLRVVRLAGSSMDGFGAQLTWFVMGLAGFVLLIACANLANLQFARHASRVREQAIRCALGASRWQLLRAILTESLLLSVTGGVLGLLVALWCNDALSHRFSFGGAHGVPIPLDWHALVFTFAVSLLTGLVFGILPAWFSSRANVNEALKQGSRGTSASHAQHRLRHTLIVSEVALALVLLAGAGFFLRGLDRIWQRDSGWRIDGLLTGRLNLQGTKYATNDARRTFYTRLSEKLTSLPGVEHAAIATSLPTWGYSSSTNFMVEGRPEPAAGAAPLATITAVMPDYFATLGLRLLSGRDFTTDDLPGNPAVVIISETMARTFWPGENPLGKRIGDPSPFFDKPQEIIGVVSDAGAPGNLSRPDSGFQVYQALPQHPHSFITVAVRTPQAPESIATDLRLAVASIDPDQPVSDLGTIHAELDEQLRSVRLAGQTLAGFAALGLLLAAVGIYGVISGFVVQRTNEIGIRMALGAQLRDVLMLVLGQGIRLALFGTGIGLVGSFGIARLLQAMAPGLPPADFVTAFVVTVSLLAVAGFACWLPAHRATKVNPLDALRAE